MRQFLRGGLFGQYCDSPKDPGARANFEHLLGIDSLRITVSFDNHMCKFRDLLCILLIPSAVSCNVTNMRHQFSEDWEFHRLDIPRAFCMTVIDTFPSTREVSSIGLFDDNLDRAPHHP